MAASIARRAEGCPPAAGLQHAMKLLQAHDATTAEEFARICGIVLGRRLMSADMRADGRLNQTGEPLEFSFGTPPTGLRYTMELGGSPARRLDRAVRLLTRLEGGKMEANLFAGHHGLQRGSPLEWGAWLGARQNLTGPTRYKVYVEPTPSAGAACLTRYLGSKPLPVTPGTRLCLVGAAPGSAECEFYFALGGRAFRLDTLYALMQHIGLAHRFDALVALIQAFEFRRGRLPDSLPDANYGFSVALEPGSSARAFSVQIHADELSGGDAGVRRQVLAVAERQGFSMPLYAALSAPLQERRTTAECHNMLTFSVTSENTSGWQVSLSPPPETIGY